MNALVYLLCWHSIDQGIHKVKLKNALNEIWKKIRGFSFSINMAYFEAFRRNKMLISNLFFLSLGLKYAVSSGLFQAKILLSIQARVGIKWKNSGINHTKGCVLLWKMKDVDFTFWEKQIDFSKFHVFHILAPRVRARGFSCMLKNVYKEFWPWIYKYNLSRKN